MSTIGIRIVRETQKKNEEKKIKLNYRLQTDEKQETFCGANCGRTDVFFTYSAS